jgi:hypothetical protein
VTEEQETNEGRLQKTHRPGTSTTSPFASSASSATTATTTHGPHGVPHLQQRRCGVSNGGAFVGVRVHHPRTQDPKVVQVAGIQIRHDACPQTRTQTFRLARLTLELN